MLILARRENEKIMINGKEIVITVVGISGSQVRLGIDAPEHMKILREEISDYGGTRPKYPLARGKRSY